MNENLNSNEFPVSVVSQSSIVGHHATDENAVPLNWDKILTSRENKTDSDILFIGLICDGITGKDRQLSYKSQGGGIASKICSEHFEEIFSQAPNINGEKQISINDLKTIDTLLDWALSGIEDLKEIEFIKDVLLDNLKLGTGREDNIPQIMKVGSWGLSDIKNFLVPGGAKERTSSLISKAIEKLKEIGLIKGETGNETADINELLKYFLGDKYSDPLLLKIISSIYRIDTIYIDPELKKIGANTEAIRKYIEDTVPNSQEQLTPAYIGCTAVMAFYDYNSNTLRCINIGDARAIAVNSKTGEIIFKTDDDSEGSNIQSFIGGILALENPENSRSTYFIPQPIYNLFEMNIPLSMLTSGEVNVIIGSDGTINEFTQEALYELIDKINDSNFAEQLNQKVQEKYTAKYGRPDDASCIVLKGNI